MDCSNARDWLLQAERPWGLDDAPGDLAAHVDGCPRCRRLAGALEGLEQRYRDELRPATAEPARDAFLARLHTPVAGPRPRRMLPRRWAAAAALLLAVGAAVWALLPTTQARGASDVVERLITWNLEITQAQALEGRARIYKEHAAELEAALEQAELPEEEREFAVALLDSGSWLAGNDDPAAEADRFNDMADRLLAQIDTATTKKDAKRLRRLADLYRRIAEQGVQANLERARKAVDRASKRKQRKLDKAIRRDAKRARRLEELLERAPEPTRKEIRRALGKPVRAKKPRKQEPFAPTP
jgi:hypothetical protein